MFWCDKTTGLSKNFWLRALGWYSMALLDMYKDRSDKNFYNDVYNEVNTTLDGDKDVIGRITLFKT